MKAVFIEAIREAYSTDKIYRTMTVGELIAFLELFDDDSLVFLIHDNGYTFGGIREYMFRDSNDDDDYDIQQD